MFFVGLTISLIFVISGTVFLLDASYLTGGVLLSMGIVSFFVWWKFYTYKGRRKNNQGTGDFTWVDCLDFRFIKKADCDCNDGMDCDCSPDCSI